MVKVTFKCSGGHTFSKQYQAGKVPSTEKCPECGADSVRCFSNVEVRSVTTEETRDATDLILYGNLPSGKAKQVY